MDEFAPVDVDIVLKDPRMQRVAEPLRALIRPSIRLHMRSTEEGEELPLGRTRFGGEPDLPVATQWPTGHVEVPPPTEAFRAAYTHGRFPTENGTFSYPFIAQIRLSEIVTHDTEHLLPARGLLYFFYDQRGFVSDIGAQGKRTSTMVVGGQMFSITHYDYEGLSPWRVLFFPDENGELERREIPTDIPEAQRYKLGVPVAIFSEPTLPHVETCFIGDEDDMRGELMLTAEEWDVYADELKSKIRVYPAHQMLGYSDDSQPMAMEGSFAQERLTLFPELPPLESLTPAERQRENTANRLLLQVDADNGMWFGRGGPLYFFIRGADLAAQDFSRVWATVQ
jgi:uncharacterized protein YwqG